MTSRVFFGCFLVVLLLPGFIDARCESGIVPSDVCNGSQKCQSQVKHVRFDHPFDMPPNVMVAISTFDIWNGANSRLTTYHSGVTSQGFNVSIKSWADTHLYYVKVSWIACL
ncbi:uncharacterized protein LOC106166253 [Lingula anatina]|uniref:Uncharacterized protein LOC106166253 n=1 Tax=Lingula anatina TaxID=7574 RepID=A0A1S3IPQ4_LINAN|nr:uncharacterized protein LOC106166253 [Lingula anatina]|eukprot:XP_013400200.1 uncharacterized protein LOC106166253 [Lingula anatina]